MSNKYFVHGWKKIRTHNFSLVFSALGPLSEQLDDGMKKAAATKAGSGLLVRELTREIRAKPAMPIRREEEGGRGIAAKSLERDAGVNEWLSQALTIKTTSRVFELIDFPRSATEICYLSLIELTGALPRQGEYLIKTIV